MDRQPGLWKELEDTDGKMSGQKYATPKPRYVVRDKTEEV